jgi:anti-sigma factor RsiW
MWIDTHDRHLSEEQLIDCYFAADSREESATHHRGHVAGCAACAQRYAELTQDLDLLAQAGASEADAVFTPDVLAHQRQQIMRRLESYGRRADIFLFPARGHAKAESRANLRRPARWVAAAAAAGLTVGLGLGLSVEHLRINRVRPFSNPITSPAELRAPSVTPSPVTMQFESASTADDELLAEIDAALVTHRIQELRALDALTPENINISLRRR